MSNVLILPEKTCLLYNFFICLFNTKIIGCNDTFYYPLMAFYNYYVEKMIHAKKLFLFRVLFQ